MYFWILYINIAIKLLTLMFDFLIANFNEDGAFRYGLDANGEPLKFVGREEFPRPPR